MALGAALALAVLYLVVGQPSTETSMVAALSGGVIGEAIRIAASR
jgi:hypothetical protein